MRCVKYNPLKMRSKKKEVIEEREGGILVKFEEKSFASRIYYSTVSGI